MDPTELIEGKWYKCTYPRTRSFTKGVLYQCKFGTDINGAESLGLMTDSGWFAFQNVVSNFEPADPDPIVFEEGHWYTCVFSRSTTYDKNFDYECVSGCTGPSGLGLKGAQVNPCPIELLRSDFEYSHPPIPHEDDAKQEEKGCPELVIGPGGIQPPVDIIVKPSHYARFAIEPVEFIMANRLSFEVGNVIKYVMRAGHKLYEGKTAEESEVIDLEKVRRYAEMRIQQLQSTDKTGWS